MHTAKKKVSISTKFLRVTLIALLILAVTTGISSVLVVNGLAKQDSELLMTQICEEEALRFDNKLNIVQHSVNLIYKYAMELYQVGGYEITSEEYLEEVRELAISVSNETYGAMAVYFRYDPELTGSGKSGFFWSRKLDDPTFEAEPPTDILAYNTNDIEHVGWFFVPKETGEALWMTPYYNQNLDVFMISYIIPIYLESGEFIGVVGMDIDFNTIMNIAGSVKLYKTGKLALIDMKEHLVYYSDENGMAAEERLSNQLYNHVTTINKASELLKINEADGSSSLICCQKLTNDMILYLNVPLKEIYANRNNLSMFLVLLTVVISGATLFVIWKNSAQVIQPLKELAVITNRYAQGDWKENYICNSGDEVQELSESISIMADNTQEYIERLNVLARTDGLTSVKNKACYLEWVEKVQNDVQKEFPSYALVVMDLNLLKKVNDNYGHEAGDALLREASRYISEVFANSMIFRIGGDEFIAVLLGEDYQNRISLCDQFEKGMFYEVAGLQGIPLAIAYGMASYPEEETDYETLFKMADERMYEKKKEMKMGRTD